MAEYFFTVDTHVHLYRSERQGWLGRAIYDRIDHGGTLEQLLRYMEEGEINQSWVINAWPTQGLFQSAIGRITKELKVPAAEAKRQAEDEVKARLERANEWLCSTATIAPDRIIPLIGIDPFFGTEWMLKELEEKHEKGAKGVKLIPTWGEFYPNDKAMWPAYEKLIELSMVILSHSGASNVLFEVEGTDYASPRYWTEVLTAFPGLKLVLAHLGYHWAYGYGTPEQKERVELAKRFPNIHFDLSQNLEAGYTSHEIDMIREIGVDRILWASDWHTHRALLGLEGLRASSFTDDEKQKILGENARRLIESK